MLSRTCPHPCLRLHFTQIPVLMTTEEGTSFFLAQPKYSSWTISHRVLLGYNREHVPTPLPPDFLTGSLDYLNLHAPFKTLPRVSHPPDEIGVMKQAALKKQSFWETSQFCSHSSMAGCFIDTWVREPNVQQRKQTAVSTFGGGREQGW